MTMSSSQAVKSKKKQTNLQWTKKLIAAVKSRPCLYNDEEDGFHDENAIKTAWTQVYTDCPGSDSQNLSGEDQISFVKSEWIACKKSFSKERSRREKLKVSNGGWTLYDDMEFMNKRMAKRKRKNKVLNDGSQKTDENSQGGTAIKIIKTETIATDCHTLHQSQKSDAGNTSTVCSNDNRVDEETDGTPSDVAMVSTQELESVNSTLSFEDQLKKDRAMRKQIESKEKSEMLRLQKEKALQEINRIKRQKQEMEDRLSQEKRVVANDTEINRSVTSLIVAVLNRTKDPKERITLLNDIMNILYS